MDKEDKQELIYIGDFERLKDFNFVIDTYSNKLTNWTYNYYRYKPINSYDVIQIDTRTRIIYMCDNARQDGLIKMYDLIQAGLVKRRNKNEIK